MDLVASWNIDLAFLQDVLASWNIVLAFLGDEASLYFEPESAVDVEASLNFELVALYVASLRYWYLDLDEKLEAGPL